MGNRLSDELSSPDGSENRKELAQDRTEWAMQRTLFARERTFSAWLRTALATVAAGLAFTGLVGRYDKALLSSGLGGLFVLVGVGIFGIALWRYWDGYRELKEEGVRMFPLWGIVILTSILILSSFIAFFVIVTAE